jgi:23S rRNA maturation-related 3'-5' exoribonuclease YhaM
LSIRQSESRREQEQRHHLASVQKLSHEIRSAIEAMEYNDLEQLQNSVARQEVLCHEITRMQWPAPATQNDAQLLKQIGDAHFELARLNRLYREVLKRAERSARVILAVYRQHGRGYSKDAPAQTDNHTVSCEA